MTIKQLLIGSAATTALVSLGLYRLATHKSPATLVIADAKMTHLSPAVFDDSGSRDAAPRAAHRRS